MQVLARSLVEEARNGGYLVDLNAGTVAAGPSLLQQPGAAPYLGRSIASYVDQFSDLLDRAAASDQRTTSTIGANLPHTQTGFGTGGSRDLSRQDLEAQRGRPPADVHAWWSGLTPQQQENAIRSYPDLVGWPDGIPATDRDTANRITLDTRRNALTDQIAALNTELADLQRSNPHGVARTQEIAEQLHKSQEELDKLTAVDRGLADTGGKGLLLGIDTHGDGRAIIAIGNPDTAAHTGVWVPGLGTEIDDTPGNTRRMIAFHEAADALTPNQPADVSTVYWLGYDAPELGSVGFEERSRDGRDPYLTFMHGMRASHEGDPGHLVAMGHSYGTTVLGEAAKTGGLPVNDIVTAGSPGMHVDHARDLHIDPKHLWAGSAADDPVSETSNATQWAPLGGAVLFGPAAGPLLGWAAGHAYEDGHNISPHTQDFGANRYTVDTSGHSDYWNRGSESLRNQAAILMGDYEAVGLTHGQRPGR